ncbi:hypothetical protein [Bizionia sp. M204]|uniref:hypothetical protein n=2 Tax=unclassified Bizionia TaxID=2626393 RepID=UPI00206BB980|nr:hypothetical protein [Bizionia sp. M204]UPS90275.1 hypothetical protein GMA17_00420 [Bizionia sp. M204]
MNTMNSLLEKIANAPSLDFGTIFSDAFDLFKKTWVQGFLLQIITFIIVLPFILLLYLPLLGIIISQATTGDQDPEAFQAYFAGLGIMYMLFFIAGILVLSVVSLALNAGFFRIMKRLDHNEPIKTSDFFYYLKGKYFGKLLILMFAALFISLIAVMLCILPIIYVVVPIYFFSIIFAFNPELPAGDIIKASFKLGNKKWLLVFGLTIIASLLAQIVGMLMCGIGILVTAPFVYHPMYLVYKNVIGFEDEVPTNHIVS